MRSNHRNVLSQASAMRSRAAWLAGALALGLLGLFGGCEGRKSGGTPVAFIDHDFGFSAAPPAGWRDMPAENMVIGGKIVHAWTPDGASTIVAFIQGPGQPVTARQVLDSSLAAAKQAGWSVGESAVTKVGDHEAMSMKVVAKGTGYATGRGDVPTYQHWIAIPKQDRVLVLLLTVPEASKSTEPAAFETMIKSVSVE